MSRRAILRLVLPILIAIMVIGIAIWRGTGQPTPTTPPPPLTMAQLAARATLLPLASETAVAPPVSGDWEMPLGTRHGAFTYNAQPFMSPNPNRGGYHLGDDLNGIGQENTDLNAPVFAASDGLVAYAGLPSPGWGGVVILLHRGPTGLRQSFYGHMGAASLAVTSGERVARGKRLGRLALTTAVDFAHLHWEIRRGITVDPGPGYASSGPLGSESASTYVSPLQGIPGLPSPRAVVANTNPPVIRIQPPPFEDGQK